MNPFDLPFFIQVYLFSVLFLTVSAFYEVQVKKKPWDEDTLAEFVFICLCPVLQQGLIVWIFYSWYKDFFTRKP